MSQGASDIRKIGLQLSHDFRGVAFGIDGQGGTVKAPADIEDSISTWWEQAYPERAAEALKWARDTGRISEAEFIERTGLPVRLP